MNEMPMICGTCNAYFEVRPTMKQGTCGYDELDEEGCAPLHDSDDSCVMWEPRTLSLEERYQQLEQVALEMLEILEAIIDPSCEESCPVYAFKPGQENCIKSFRKQLQALGVNVDD